MLALCLSDLDWRQMLLYCDVGCCHHWKGENISLEGPFSTDHSCAITCGQHIYQYFTTVSSAYFLLCEDHSIQVLVAQGPSK